MWHHPFPFRFTGSELAFTEGDRPEPGGAALSDRLHSS